MLFIIVLLMALATTTTADAQTNWKARFAFNVVPYNGTLFDDVKNYDVYTAEVGVMYKDRFLEPFSFVEQYIPVYGNVKYYQPVLKWLKVFGAIDMGCEFRHLTESQKEFVHLKDNKFLFYPKIGVFVKIYGRLGVEASIGRRMTFCNMWMPTFSIVF